jgi:hypothetical protein
MRRALAVVLIVVFGVGSSRVAGAERDLAEDGALGGVRADFNNDGFADLAVAAPGESVGTVGGAGAVNVLYGSSAGLSGADSQLLTQNIAGVGSTAEEGDSFGGYEGTLAAGDFDGDGFTDLAVGVPLEDVGSVVDAGAINVLFGTSSGLTGAGSQLFTQDAAGIGSTAEEFDSFGWALTAGDFDADGIADLAIGVPFEDVGSVVDAGAINVLFGSAGGLARVGSQLFTQDSAGIGSTAEAYDNFGRALAAGDYSDDGVADLAVGVPTEAVGDIGLAGAVNVLFGSASGLAGGESQLFTQDTAGVGGTAELVDQLGWALATGDFNGDGTADLAVGVPTEDVGAVDAAGAVNVLYGSTRGLSGVGSQLFTQDTSRVISTAEAGDGFGVALAAGDFDDDGFTDLAVSASGESVGTIPGAGAVNILPGSADKLTGTGSQIFTQDVPGVGSAAEADDLFATALAAADFDDDGHADLAVGSPWEGVGAIPAAGAINVLYGAGNGLVGTGSQLFTQDSPGIGSTVEAFDNLGFALAALQTA